MHINYKQKKSNGLYANVFKRIIDVIVSLLFIICFFWLYIIIAVLVKIKIGSPIIFKQKRPGKIDAKTSKEKIFLLYKFRTMTNEKDKNGNLLSDEKRLTSFGKWLRSTSLDEIPEFFNILKGDMSLIGPRPLLVQYLDRYNEEQRHRHDVRPGLTGLAQVNGRNLVSWEERFKLDVEYVNSVSLVTDFKIIINTIIIVFKKEGINSAESITMDEFVGTK